MGEFVTLMPPGSTPVERAVDTVDAARLDAIPVPLRDLVRPATCPAPHLAWLAWALSVDEWDPSWPEPVKRAVIAQAIPQARRRGSVQSVRDAVLPFGASLALREWHEMDPPGPAHTFDLVLTVAGGETAQASYIEAAIAAVERAKPARSHFTVTQGLEAAGGLGLQGGARVALHHRLKFEEAA